MKDWTYIFRRLPTDPGDLERLAQRLGVSLFATVEGGGGIMGMNTYEVQRRIREMFLAPNRFMASVNHAPRRTR